MIFDFEKIEPKDRYKLMAGGIIPRPIAWIVTVGVNGVVNIAPFSYFTGLSSNPPTVIVSIGHKSDGSQKDTLKNIRETKKCTICLCDEKELEPMHFSSKELPQDTSESETFDIETKVIDENFPPIVKDVPLAFFCHLHSEVELKGSKTIPLILEIKKEYAKDGVIDENLRTNFKPIARVGGEYAFLCEPIKPPEMK